MDIAGKAGSELVKDRNNLLFGKYAIMTDRIKYNLDLYQLRTFFKVAQALSFTSAAAKLHITQSAVSHAVKKLEKTAGEELFRRKNSALTLTEAGQILYRACETVFYELEKAEEALGCNKNRQVGIIRLGSTVEFGTTMLVKYMKDFIRSNPAIHIDFQFRHDLLKPLLDDELDVVIDCKAHTGAGIEKTTLFREEYVVIASREFVKNHKIKKPADLAVCPVMSIDKNCQWWGNFLHALPAAARPEFKSVIEMSHIRGIVNGAIESLGAGFVPKYCVLKELKSGALLNIFQDLKLLEDQFCVYQKEKKAGFERHKKLTAYLSGLKLPLS